MFRVISPCYLKISDWLSRLKILMSDCSTNCVYYRTIRIHIISTNLYSWTISQETRTYIFEICAVWNIYKLPNLFIIVNYANVRRSSIIKTTYFLYDYHLLNNSLSEKVLAFSTKKGKYCRFLTGESNEKKHSSL